ncbi:tetratricopeptide repeat protein [Iocasia frigidifontis]|uniref:peptidylprolyl isomerase n=2 Tax=Iocasia fonsfrigidae TaxID=2682810 RepID=A0A8A7K968_9FIRM|nr:tetratricopeptide repeat protein [Iocasia fonsfrigidae]
MMLKSLRNYSKIIIIVIVVAMVVTGALLGYGRYLNKPATTKAQSQYVAQVNGSNISEEEYYYIMQNQTAGANFERSQIVPFKVRVLDSIIETEILLQEADKMDIQSTITEEDVQDYYDTFLENNEMTEEDLVAELGENTKLTDFKDYIRNSLEKNDLINQVMERSYSNVTVTEDEVIEAYETIQPQVIMVRFGEDKDAARAKIEEAYAELKASKDFAGVADEYSDLVVGEGKLGNINRDNGYFSEETSNELFNLDKGVVSDIITDDKAYYIVKVLDKKLAEGEDYQAEKEEIKEQLLKSKQNKAFANWLESVKAESDIQINDPQLSGYKYLSQGNYQKAVEQLELALKTYPVPMTYLYLAEAYKANSMIDKADETYKKAVEAFPEDWELNLLYGNFLAGRDEVETEDALAKIDAASKLAGDDIMAHYRVFMVYSQLGADEKADEEAAIIKEIQEKIKAEQEENIESSTDDNDTTNE